MPHEVGDLRFGDKVEIWFNPHGKETGSTGTFVQGKVINRKTDGNVIITTDGSDRLNIGPGTRVDKIVRDGREVPEPPDNRLVW